MNLVLHIVKKDLRHTRIYVAVWLMALAASWWVDLQVLANQIAYTGLQGPADAVALSALALFAGSLFLAEPLPGVRAYWRARPMRGRDLLLAKALTLGLAAVLPVAISQWAVVALRGFPVHEHVFELTWNSLLVVASYTVPIAALSSISHRFQSLLLISIGAVIVAYGPLILRQSDPIWGQEAAALWIALAGGAVVLCWQYQSRHTTAGRVAVTLLCLLVGSTALLPEPFWRSLRRAASPPLPHGSAVELTVATDDLYWGSPRTTRGRGWLSIRMEVSTPAPEWRAEIRSFRTERIWAEDRSATEWKDEPTTLESPFLDTHDGRLVNLDRVAEVEVLGPGQFHLLPMNQRAYLPGVGWCQNKAGDMLRLECQTVLDPPGTLRASWGPVQLFSAERPIAPRGALPSLHPVKQFTGSLGGGGSFAAYTIRIEARTPIVYLQRRLAIRDFLLAEKRR